MHGRQNEISDNTISRTSLHVYQAEWKSFVISIFFIMAVASWGQGGQLPPIEKISIEEY